MNIQETVHIIQGAYDRALKAHKKTLSLSVQLGIIAPKAAAMQHKMKSGDYFLINNEYLTAYITHLTENRTNEISPDELLALCPDTPSKECLEAMENSIRDNQELADANPDSVKNFYESTNASYEHMHLALSAELGDRLEETSIEED